MLKATRNNACVVSPEPTVISCMTSSIMRVVSVCVGLCLLFPGASQGETFVYQPDGAVGKDAIITQQYPDNNYDHNSGRLVIGENNGVPNIFEYSLIEFDLTSLPILATTATLRLRVLSSCASLPADVTVSQVTSAWNEGSVTWNTRPTWSGTPLATTFVSTKDEWYEWDITSLYQAWKDGGSTNHGLVLFTDSPNNEGFTIAASDAGSAEYRPILEVVGNEYIWSSTMSGDWGVADNWNPNQVPITDAEVFIQPLDGLVVTGPSVATTLRRLEIGATVSGVAELRLRSAVSLAITDDLVLGDLGKVEVDGALSAGGGIANAGEIEMVSGGTLTGGMLTNTGLVHGSGSIGNVLDNNTGGQVRAMIGDLLTFTGAGNTNSGAINLLGGAVTFDQDLTNEADGTISGRGVLTCTGGLINEGDIQFSGGVGEIHGEVTNTGSIIVTGGTAADIHDNLLHNAGEVRVSQAGHLTTHADVTIAAAAEANVTGVLTALNGIANAGDIELIGGGQVNGAALANTGLVHGDGIVGNPLDNQDGGEVRVGAGQRIRMTGSVGSNLGLLRNNGGVMEFDAALVNDIADTDEDEIIDVIGTISGSGVFEFGGGLNNKGEMNLESGFTDVFGTVNLSDADNAVLTVASGGHATFYGNVGHDGVAIDTSASARTVFYGDVTGPGAFTGAGEVIFEGSYSPGSSPAAVSLQGDVTFGANSTLIIELGGLIPGDEHDQLSIGGEFTPGGTLQVSLIDDLVLAEGDTFDILDFTGSPGAAFHAVELPGLSGRKVWDISGLYVTGEISVIGMLDGDTDVDWDVDDADLAAFVEVFGAAGDWRTDFNEDGSIDLMDFIMLRENFGTVVESAPIGQYVSSTPEPATLVMFALGGLAVFRRRGRRC
jgi:hypothetical protein